MTAAGDALRICGRVTGNLCRVNARDGEGERLLACHLTFLCYDCLCLGDDRRLWFNSEVSRPKKADGSRQKYRNV